MDHEIMETLTLKGRKFEVADRAGRREIARKISRPMDTYNGSGEINDCDSGFISNMIVEGKTTQTGTPTPNTKAPMTGIEKFTCIFYDVNLLALTENSQTMMTVTENGITVKPGNTAKWSQPFAKIHMIAGQKYFFALNATGTMYGRFALSKSFDPYFTPTQANSPLVEEALTMYNLLRASVAQVTFTAVETCDAYLWYCSDSDNTGSNPGFVCVPTISESGYANEPMTAQIGTITPPRELHKIGDYADICDVENGVWRYRTTKAYQHGDVGFGLDTSNTAYSWPYAFSVNASAIDWDNGYPARVSDDTVSPIMCNVATAGKASAVQGSGTYSNLVALGSSGQVYMSLVGVGSQEAAISYLNAGEAELIAGAQKESVMEINPEDLYYLLRLKTYDGSTNVQIVDQNGQDVTTRFEYFTGIENYFKAMISDELERLRNAIVALGGTIEG